MTDAGATDPFEGWVILELMGHRRLAGWLSEQEIAGEGFLRLDIPKDGGTLLEHTATQFYRPAAVYCITPTTEETARQVAKLAQPTPVRRWELPSSADENDLGGAPADYDG
jgi:hypothetical protein